MFQDKHPAPNPSAAGGGRHQRRRSVPMPKELNVIDIRTLMLALAIGNIGFAVLMAGYERAALGTVNPALRTWTWARLVMGCAHLISWSRPDLPQVWFGVLGSAALTLGIALEVAAYCIFFRFERWKTGLAALTALVLLSYPMAQLCGASGQHLLVLRACVVALYCGATGLILLRRGEQSSLLQAIIGTANLLVFLAAGSRAWIGIHGGALTPARPDLIESLGFLTGFLCMIVNGFGFLLLCKVRDDHLLARLASTDSLTGLATRRAFFERTASARTFTARLSKPIALMMLDIDHFKSLNDRYGHAAGDDALCVFAATAQQLLREHDIMGRLGGEEFALVLPGADLDGARQMAERLRQAVATVVMPNHGDAFSMTVSIGVVRIAQDEHIKAALARADEALFAAKRGGRNRVEAGDGEALLRHCA
jgi:diguanylate cyclase (GGDEF)-like protein